MLELNRLRKVDPDVVDLSDTQLEEVRAKLYEVAQLAFDLWHLNRGGSKNLIGSFPSEDSGRTISL